MLLCPDLFRVSLASSACRFLVEYVAARPSEGEEPLSLDSYDRLIALASEIIQFGTASDYIHHDIIDIPMSIVPSGRLGRDSKSFTAARDTYLRTYMAGEINRAGRSFAIHWFQRSQIAEDQADERVLRQIDKLDVAVKSEFGVGLKDTVEFLFAIFELGRKIDSQVKQLPLDTLTVRLRQKLQWNTSKVQTAIDMMSLRPRQDFLDPIDVDKQEVYPWRFNRALSYLRRPLIIRDTDQRSKVYWGNRHVYLASKYFFTLCFGGRLKAQSEALSKEISDIRSSEAKAFEILVGEVLDQQEGVIAKSRINKINGERLLDHAGNSLGDIDVLATVSSQRLIIAAECKDLALARTPQEMQNQLTTLFKGDCKSESTVLKHMKRVRWLEEHLADVLNFLGVEICEGWIVKPILVSGTELFTPYLVGSPFPVVGIEELRDMPIASVFESRVRDTSLDYSRAIPPMPTVKTTRSP